MKVLQTIANTISITFMVSAFVLATNVCKVWLPVEFFGPLFIATIFTGMFTGLNLALNNTEGKVKEC